MSPVLLRGQRLKCFRGPKMRICSMITKFVQHTVLINNYVTLFFRNTRQKLWHQASNSSLMSTQAFIIRVIKGGQKSYAKEENVSVCLKLEGNVSVLSVSPLLFNDVISTIGKNTPNKLKYVIVCNYEGDDWELIYFQFNKPKAINLVPNQSIIIAEVV